MDLAVGMDQRETIASQRAGMREHDREHGGAGNSRVYRVTVRAEHLDGGSGGKLVSRHDGGFAPLNDLNRHALTKSIVANRNASPGGKRPNRPGEGTLRGVAILAARANHARR